MKPFQLAPFFLMILLAACSSREDIHEQEEILPIGAPYHDDVGDIPFDPLLDDSTFVLCNERVIQYYNFGNGIMYDGERPALIRQIEESYRKKFEVDGYVTIRFVVNCEGSSDRFRSEYMDNEYVVQNGQEALEEQFLEIVKSCEGWQGANYESTSYPYHQYLTFRLEHGEITRIIP